MYKSLCLLLLLTLTPLQSLAQKSSSFPVLCAGTDDNLAITAAVNAASLTSGTVQIPYGCRTSKAIILPDSASCVNLLGPGSITVISGSNLPALISKGNNVISVGCFIRDLVLKGNASVGNIIQIQRGKEWEISGNQLYDSTSDALRVGATTGGTAFYEGKIINNFISFSSTYFTPATRPAYGIHLLPFATDNTLRTNRVQNPAIADVELDRGAANNLIDDMHGYGYPLSYSSTYCIEDFGGGPGNRIINTYGDGCAVSVFHLAGNNTNIIGGVAYWGDTTSFPGANIATVEAGLSGLTISSMACNNMLASPFKFNGSPSPLKAFNLADSCKAPKSNITIPATNAPAVTIPLPY